MNQIEFDPAKDAINRVKHELSLSDAAEMDWERAVILPDERIDYGEARFRAYGMFCGRLHMAVFTPRGATRRIISFRPASRMEIKRYERFKKA